MKKKDFFMFGYKKQIFEGEEAGEEGAKGGEEKEGSEAGEKKHAAKYSDEDLDRIINKKFSDWQKKQQKAVDEAKKLAEMNAEERAKHERDELQKELDELKRANTLNEMQAEARRMLTADSINAPDDLIKALIREDAETTAEAVKAFSALFKKAVQDAVKDALKGKTPPAGGSSTVTKADIMKIADRAERQRMISEHIDLFRK